LVYMKAITGQIGRDLVEYSKHAEFSAQRGLLEELFPHIYLASKRLSCRAISRWLAEERNVKLSYVSVGRALRNAEYYWRVMAEEIEPAARAFAEAHDADQNEVLMQRERFEALCLEQPRLCPVGEGSAAVGKALREYEQAREKLRQEWFVHDDEVLAHCEKYLTVEEQQSKEAEGRAQG